VITKSKEELEELPEYEGVNEVEIIDWSNEI
jgi:hypothetical protein